MLHGHGDDIHSYSDIRINFSSNIYSHFSHQGLYEHLRGSVALIANYPEPTASSLEEALTAHNQLRRGEVMVTNGVTDAIYLIARTFHNYPSVITQPTFAEYADACRAAHPLVADSAESGGRLHWLCVPNNPTGEVTDKTAILTQLRTSCRDIFVIDASYAAYTDTETITAREAVRYTNVLMLHSMTKDYGVPGLRLGYITGDAALLSMLRTRQQPWSVNALAIEAGHYLLAHDSEYSIPVAEILSERQRMETTFSTMGIGTHHSDSHMLVCRLPHGTAADLKQYLVTQHGILIRDASNFDTLTPQHFRIAVQTPEENTALIDAVSQWLNMR